MTRIWQWLRPTWLRRQEDRNVEAIEQLARLDEQAAEVVDLGKQLRRIAHRNNFSGLVADAIARGAHREGSP